MWLAVASEFQVGQQQEADTIGEGYIVVIINVDLSCHCRYGRDTRMLLVTVGLGQTIARTVVMC
jgi:hypothetical protein